MGTVTDYLDPNAASYTDDEIVGKVNAATANITRAGSIEGTAASDLDTDDISEGTANKYDTGTPPTTTDDLNEGSTNKYDTGVPPTATETMDAIVAMADDDREIVITRPITGQFKLYAVERQDDGTYAMERSDTAES